MVGQVSLSSCEYERNIDEFKKTGLHKQESLCVKPPFVKESPFVMECKLHDIIYLGNKPASGNLILGEIVMFHISDKILNNKDQIDPFLLDAISRMGGSWYSKSKSGLFEFKKPGRKGIGFDSLPNNVKKRNILTANELSELASIDTIPKIIDKFYDIHQNKSFNDAKQKIKGNPLDTDGERLNSLQNGMMNLCDGLISLRKQNGAITGIMTTAVLLNERTSQQLEKALKKI